jgi:hypothetical protein
MNADKSYVTRINLLKSRTLSVYHTLNPKMVEFGKSQYADSEYQTRRVGDQVATCDCSASCVPPGDFTIAVSNYNENPPPPYDTDYNVYYDISWDPVPNATSYTVSINYTLPYLLVNTGTYTARLYMSFIDPYPSATIIVSAINECGQSEAIVENVAPCFLAGSLVQIADGTVKAIEDVSVGDLLLGAFGEINAVLALHRPLLGDKLMCRINDEHSTTNHHPHVSVDRQFYCNDPYTVDETTYNRYHEVINKEGERVQRFLHGLKKGRVQQLQRGVDLKTVDGSRIVDSLETYSLPPETQLYNLVVAGSHTYHVDGYAVTGWPREDDFDYDAWVQKSVL